jgi:Domain of unknown function (DUF4440)
MTRWRYRPLPLALLLLAFGAQADSGVEAALQQKTQALLDAITSGDPARWRTDLDERVLLTTEDGEVLTKEKLVEQIRPLPPGVQGRIRVMDFKAVVRNQVAVTSYVSDEEETFHGQKLHCQYRGTDTWVKSAEGWKLVAGQILALRNDPPAVQLEPAKRAEICGRYRLEDLEFEIRCVGDGLEGQQKGRPARPLRVEAPDVLFTPGQPRYRRIIQRDAQGRITGFLERREAWDLSWKRLP